MPRTSFGADSKLSQVHWFQASRALVSETAFPLEDRSSLQKQHVRSSADAAPALQHESQELTKNANVDAEVLPLRLVTGF